MSIARLHQSLVSLRKFKYRLTDYDPVRGERFNAVEWLRERPLELITCAGKFVQTLHAVGLGGELTNHGRKNAPRVRRGDLPQKAATVRKGVSLARKNAYDPIADARSLRSRQGER